MNWPTTRLDAVSVLDRQSVHPLGADVETFYIGLEHVDSDGLIDCVETIGSAEIKSNKFRFTDRHILFGKLRPYLRKIARPGFSGVCSTDIIPILVKEGLSRDYLFHLLRTPPMVELATSLCSGANLPRLSPKQLAAFKIPLPPLAEQKRIARILDAADALRQKRHESIAQLGMLLQSTFLDMFGDPVTNPMGWEVSSLGNLVQNEDGRRVPLKKENREKMDNEFPYYGASGVIDSVDNFLFDGDRLLIGEDGENLVSRATPIAFIAKGKYWVNNHAHVLADNGRAELTFLKTTVNIIDLKPYLSGSAQPKLNQKNLNRIPIPSPPLDLQHRFAAITESIEQQKNRQCEYLAELDSLFASLQSLAFKGEL
jgi:type I restriction enzyme, S subunit